MYLQNYGLPKTTSKMSLFRASVEKQHGKCAETLLKFEIQLLQHIHWSLGKKLSYKKSLVQICKITKLSPNTLSSDGKYSLLDRDDSTQRIQMLLSRKQKTFFEFFSSILKSSLNLEPFQKEDDTHSCWIYEILDSKKHG